MDSGLAAYYPDYDEAHHSALLAQSQQPRQRRRQSATSDGPKHRRTRSGCYTCRQRRVKCDETHPICTRCRKGKRECHYPPNTSAGPGTVSSTASSRVPHGEGVKRDVTTSGGQSSPTLSIDEHLSANPGENSPEKRIGSQQSSPATPTARTGLESEYAGVTTERDPAHRTEKHAQNRPSASRHAKDHDLTRSEKWQRLPKEMDAYLRYHREHMTYHHYAFKCDKSDFLKTTFLEIALNDDTSALLYAIVAFAAYHHAIRRARDSWQTFLVYYNKAIWALKPLLESRRHNTATLLTILQLATIEEFLGDWLNVDFHKRAAVTILTDIYRVETIMQDETRRKIIMWFCRFDVFSSILSGHHPCLGREWFSACEQFYSQQHAHHPGDVSLAIEHCFARARLMATDIAIVFAEQRHGRLTGEQFSRRLTDIRLQLDAYKRHLDTHFDDDSCYASVDEISDLKPGEIGIVSYREPRLLFKGDYFIMNFVVLDCLALELIFEYKIELAQGRRTSPRLIELSLEKCKIIEAITHANERPDAAIFSCQASLAMLGLFVGTTKDRIEWCRRKLAMAELAGYIYPFRIHQQMTRLWSEDVMDWWLSNGAQLTRTIRLIREFDEFRKEPPQDLCYTDVWAMNGIFRSPEATDSGTSPADSRLPRVDSGYAYRHLPQGSMWMQPEPVTTSG